MAGRKRYSREFKLEAVKLVTERGVSAAQAARDLGVHVNVLRTWVRELRADPVHAFPGHGTQKPEDAEVTRLRREVARLKMERDILKKSRGLLREGVDVKFGFVAKHRGIRPVDVQCGALGVSRSGFYAWLRARPPRRARPSDAGPRPLHQVAPHLLARDFTATAPDQKWVADFTYLWTGEGWLFVAAVLDLFSRRVVGWSMQPTMTAQLVTDALVTAVWRRGGVAAEALLHHSDHGSQYTSETFQRQLAGLGITCSMSRSGNVWDNAVMESFFSTLKVERCHRRHYTSRDEARADIFDYVERFYNPVRRHSTLGNVSPVAFEQQAARAGAVAVA